MQRTRPLLSGDACESIRASLTCKTGRMYLRVEEACVETFRLLVQECLDGGVLVRGALELDSVTM